MIKIFNFNESIEFSANSYLVYNKSNECVLIDCGSTLNTIIRFISSNSLKLKALLLTHGHFDHIRGIPNLIKHFGYFDIYISKYDEELLKEPGLNCSKFNCENVKLDIKVKTLNNLEELNFGDNLKFEVIETPFHTDGSVCYLDKMENALFSGDTLFKNSIGRYDLVTSNQSLVYDSLEKLKYLNENLVVYPGHGEITTLKDELKNNVFLK